MSLVFAGVCSHAPGIIARFERGDPNLAKPFHENLYRMGEAIHEAKPDALIMIGAEHFANFFMNNMPPYCMGMGEYYEGPIEDPDWLRIKPFKVAGNADLSKRLISAIMQEVDIAYAEEWKFDHGIAVPLHFLTPEHDIPIIPVNINCQGPPLSPLHRAWAFGRALRKAIDAQPERIAVVGTGGISHWPATPDSGKINEAWDRKFLDDFVNNRKEALLAYTDEETLRDAGQGGFEIRTFVSVAGLCEGSTGKLWYYAPIPIFAVGCTVATMDVEPAAAA